MAGFIKLLADGFALAIELDFQIFAHVHRVDAVVAHVFEGALDSFPLGIEYCLFRRDDDLGFHSIDFEHRMSNGNGRMVKANFSRCVHFSGAAIALNRQSRKENSNVE